jgi:outer membrane protein
MKIRLTMMACALVLAVGPAMAQSQGDWLVRAGLGVVYTDVDSGDLTFEGMPLEGYQIDVDNSIRPVFNVTWMATDHVGIELLASAPFRHGIDGDGALEELGRLGSTKHLPPTLSLQWHFLPGNTLRPYAGIGLNYTHFFDESTTDALHQGIISTANAATGSNYAGGSSEMSISSSTGLALQLGFDVALENNWFVNLDVRWIDIDADARITTQTFDGAGQAATLNSRIESDLDPWVVSTTVGYRF